MLKITIETGGSAFEPLEYECARILNKCARYLEAKAEFEDNTDYKAPLMDINGNKVGEMEVIR